MASGGRLGLVTVNTRIQDHRADAGPRPRGADRPWRGSPRRLATALALRERLFDAPFYRLVHAEADGLPGVVIDRFGEAAVIQPNAAWAEAQLTALVEALVEVTGVTDHRQERHGPVARAGRAARGNGAGTGQPRRSGAGADERGHLHGRPAGRAEDRPLLRPASEPRLCRSAWREGARVLDVFTHVGGFGLAALAGGATQALAVDASAAGAGAGRGGGAGQRASPTASRRGRAMPSTCWRRSAPTGAPFRSGDLRSARLCARRNRRSRRACAPTNGSPGWPRPLVAPGGYLVLCSCSHAADLTAFRNASARGIGRGGRRAQLLHTGFAGPDHPMLPQLAETAYLKALFFRLDG